MTRAIPRSDLAGRARRLLGRTALCGALYGLAALAPQTAMALPVGGAATQVSAGGGAPVVASGNGRLDVTLNAPRTVMSWTTYDVAAGETVSYAFGGRDWIVLNKIDGLQLSRIEGTVEGRVGNAFGGNIWFASQNSIIVGATGRVDAGGFLAAMGKPDLTGFLDPANTLFSFSGSDIIPGAKLMVLSGGQVNGHGGLVAFAGPSIVTRYNATVTASGGGDVLYGAAKTYQIRLAPGAAGDFDLVDFIVDAPGGSDALVMADLAGDTSANSVFVAAVSRAALGNAVINVEGLVTAQAAKADGGDIVLSGGGGIADRRPAGPAANAAGGTLYLNRASASRDLLIENVGQIIARPWLRPPSETQDPPAIDDACQDLTGCGYYEEYYEYYGEYYTGFNSNDGSELLSSLFDPTAISTLNAGRDARIGATADVELGRIIAGGDIGVSGPTLKVNGLTASGDLTASATAGGAAIAGVGVLGSGAVSAATDVSIDTISAPQSLTVTAGRDVLLGDGTSDVSGLVSVDAARNVAVNLASARIDRIIAGGLVDLRGGALDIGAVSGSTVLAQSASVRIGEATSAGDIYLVSSGGDAGVTTATAGDDIYILATHGTASLGSATLTGQGADAVGGNFAGNPDTAGNGRILSLGSADLDASLGQGTGGVSGATAVTVTAGQDALVDVLSETSGALTVVAGRDATLKAPSASLGAVTAGRDLTVGNTVGDFTITSPLNATHNITVTAAGALTVGDVRADSGSITLTGASITAGSVSASEDLVLQAASGGVSTSSYAVGRDLIVQGSSLSLGGAIGPVSRDLSITSLGDFTSSTPLSAGRDLTLDVAGKASIGQATAGGDLRLAARDLDLTGNITAANAQIESRSGPLRVGGSAGSGGGFVLDNGEFGRLRVSGSLRIYAGSTTGPERGGLVLQDLTINPAATPDVAFLVGPDFDAQVQGLVAPTASGGVLRIGDATDLGWRPGSILISGGLGAATYSAGGYTGIRAFDELRLAAREDILMGSPRFISLIQGTDPADINISAALPDGVAPLGDEQYKVFAAMGRLEVSAENKVVQQNTAPLGTTDGVGLFLTGAASPALIIDPPNIVELFGAFSGNNGQTVSGIKAGSTLSFTVVDGNGLPIAIPPGAQYRFNSCEVGTSVCAGLAAGGGSSIGERAVIAIARDQLSDSALDLPAAAGAAALSSETQADSPTLLGVASAENDDVVIDPVLAGAGSEEIWRQRRQKQ
jgi:filamentous hemagglutinin family protein